MGLLSIDKEKNKLFFNANRKKIYIFAMIPRDFRNLCGWRKV